MNAKELMETDPLANMVYTINLARDAYEFILEQGLDNGFKKVALDLKAAGITAEMVERKVKLPQKKEELLTFSTIVTVSYWFREACRRSEIFYKSITLDQKSGYSIIDGKSTFGDLLYDSIRLMSKEKEEITTKIVPVFEPFERYIFVFCNMHTLKLLEENQGIYDGLYNLFVDALWVLKQFEILKDNEYAIQYVFANTDKKDSYIPKSEKLKLQETENEFDVDDVDVDF